MYRATVRKFLGEKFIIIYLNYDESQGYMSKTNQIEFTASGVMSNTGLQFKTIREAIGALKHYFKCKLIEKRSNNRYVFEIEELVKSR